MGGKRERSGVVAVSETSIQITFTFKGVLCRERLKLKPTAANLKRAELHRAAILHAISIGTFDYSVTFPDSPRRFKFSEEKGDGHFLEDWLQTWLYRQKPHIKTSTWDGYRKIVYNVLIPEIGKIYLSDLRRNHVRKMCDKMTSVTNKRLSNIQSVLRSSLQNALDDDILDANPLYGWRYKRAEAPKPNDHVDPFNKEEQASIIAACKDRLIKNLFQAALWSGLRTNELVALNWDDIDLKRGVIRIWKGKTQAAKVAETPKTKRSVREVKILLPARKALLDQKKLTFSPDKNSPVFINPNTGDAWTGDQQIRNAWMSILEIANIRYRNPYQTRHTYASMMLSAGETPVWLAGQMGHTDVNMIYKIYARWIPDAAPNAGQRAVEIFG
ncbi:site-specific integrase [Oxalobacter formigenes]|uniref:site-specific integrase n=1 Tax=Oxalobacter formigenes TaxID=847 RepID=UPI0022AE6DEC|nr:site-specific integrase [Oxalobacter formigenes]WAW06038.1 site-specific integrase [Oxalobacter formigenes]